jgi:monovalent cation/proton antiporter MnhG/PhaG subunit
MDVLIYMLVVLGVATALFSTIGILVMKDINERLHYLSPPATLSIGLITVAIALQEGDSQATVKAVLCAFTFFVTNPVLTHATARAARIREFGHWVSEPGGRRKRAG